MGDTVSLNNEYFGKLYWLIVGEVEVTTYGNGRTEATRKCLVSTVKEDIAIRHEVLDVVFGDDPWNGSRWCPHETT